MRVLFLVQVLFPLLGFARQGNDTQSSSRPSHRQGKLFSVFSIVTFNNNPCQSSSSTSSGNSAFRNGTCFTNNECVAKGGSVQGSCASGFGVCCVFVISDVSRTISENCTYIQNPGFPTPLTTSTALSYSVAKSSNDVCFLRLDFESFSLQGPADTLETSGGVCTDTFVVTTQTGQQIPTICGQNAGQHIYVDIGNQASDTATLAFTFTGSSSNRQWEIKVSQIPCGANFAPSPGCLQYVTGLTGRLTTFNFLDVTGSSHLASTQYTQCIRQEAGFCCIRYQVCGDANSFSLDTTMMAAAAAAQTDNTCTLDYLGIEGATQQCQAGSGGSTTSERFCGNFFSTQSAGTANSIVCDCSPPFAVTVRTDAMQDANAATQPNRGVCLMFDQIPC